MNTTYGRYLKEEEFRAGILETARRERAQEMGRFLLKLLTLNSLNRKPSHAARAHFARQG
jgi:hypothetical protein